jgi:hypothetical protein
MIRNSRHVISILAASAAMMCAGYGALWADHAPARKSFGAAQKTAAQPRATLADLAWMAGHWTGTVGNGTIEQFCSEPTHGVMMGMFRASMGDKTAEIELYTMQETPNGIEEHIRFFKSTPLEPDDPPEVTMMVKSVSPNEIVFENPTGNYPKRSTVTHNGANAFHTHIELIDGQGKSAFIDADWQRVQ